MEKAKEVTIFNSNSRLIKWLTEQGVEAGKWRCFNSEEGIGICLCISDDSVMLIFARDAKRKPKTLTTDRRKNGK